MRASSSRRTRLAVPLLCAFVPLLALAPRSSALRPSHDYLATPRDYGIVFQDVTFPSSDSLRLVGWFYPAQDTAGIANDLVGRVIPVPENLRRPARAYDVKDPSPRATIIICGGDGGNMADLIFYAYQFFTRGFHVPSFDWRGFGGSADWPMDPDQLCYPEFLRDYAGAIDYVKTRPEVDPDRIGLLGFSTGAYLSFAMLASRSDVRAFAGRALLTSFDDIQPILHGLDPQRGWKAPKDYPTAYLPINAAPKVRAPVFLVVGEEDTRTPPWMSQKIIEKLAGPKDLWIVPGAGHGGPTAPEFLTYPEFFERAAAFNGRFLRPS